MITDTGETDISRSSVAMSMMQVGQAAISHKPAEPWVKLTMCVKGSVC
jgi:hypothetical protein